MKKIVISIFLILLGFGAFTIWKSTYRLPPTANSSLSLRPHVVIGSTTYFVDVADTPALQTHGLSDRPSMARDEGMLFIFDHPQLVSFWMKDMHFPLDFVWINNGTIIDLTSDVPAPTSPNDKLPIYQPKSAADWVLEINAGEIAKNNFTIGQKVMFTR